MIRVGDYQIVAALDTDIEQPPADTGAAASVAVLMLLFLLILAVVYLQLANRGERVSE